MATKTVENPVVGLKVLHFGNSFVTDNAVLSCPSDFGPTNTDRSTYRPEISLIRAQQGARDGKTLMYDFNDGKDTGDVVQTFLRSPGLDVTEIDSASRRITQIVEDKAQTAEEKAKADSLREKFEKSLDDKLGDSSSSDVDSAQNTTQNTTKTE